MASFKFQVVATIQTNFNFTDLFGSATAVDWRSAPKDEQHQSFLIDPSEQTRHMGNQQTA